MSLIMPRAACPDILALHLESARGICCPELRRTGTDACEVLHCPMNSRRLVGALLVLLNRVSHAQAAMATHGAAIMDDRPIASCQLWDP